jgi:hypothetical protein
MPESSLDNNLPPNPASGTPNNTTPENSNVFTVTDAPPITLDSTALDITSGAGGAQLVSRVQERKGDFANLIALIIVGSFSGVILFTLIAAIAILWKSGDPVRVKLFVDALTLFLNPQASLFQRSLDP